MTNYRRGDVVLVSFDFTDGSGSKWRPAIIVSDDRYNRESPDVLIASITSNPRALHHPGDHPISDWHAAGLLKPSLAQMKLATIDASILGRKQGTLTAADLMALDRGLRLALNL
jgi:mRNA interferase MazF